MNKNHYNPKNCDNRVRGHYVINANTLQQVEITIFGKHAHQYTLGIVKYETTSFITFPNRTDAIKELKRLLNAYKF